MIASVRRRLGTLSAGCALTALAAAALPVSAQAYPVDISMCDNATLTQPFGPWADVNYYKLAPGADFEGSLAGWSLTGGAQQGSGSESFGVTGSVGSSSLSLPAGSLATSPKTCVNAAYPDFRLFTRTDNPGATISVAVLYRTASGTTTIPVGLVTPAASWQPSLPMATASAIAGALNGGNADVSLRFTASGGTTQVDDVYIDPSGRCC